MSEIAPAQINRDEYLRQHGWAETPSGWVMKDGFCKPLPLDAAFKLHAIIDELDQPDNPPPIVTRKMIDDARSANGGWSRDTLAKWGVAWPPPKGWKESLLAKAHPLKAPTHD